MFSVKMPDFTRHSLECAEKFAKYIEDSQQVSAVQVDPVPPFVKSSFTNSSSINVKLFKAHAWDISFDPEKELGQGYTHVLDVKCKGHNILKEPQYYLCVGNPKSEAVYYVNHYDEVENRIRQHKRTYVCCRELELDVWIQFEGFLRIYQKGDVFHLIGLERLESGEVKMMYHVKARPNSKNVAIACLDFEKQIMIWAKDKSAMAKVDKLTGRTIHETVLLEFETSTVYKVVSAILKCPSPSYYSAFLTERIMSDNSFIVEHRPQEKIVGTMEVTSTEIRVTCEEPDEFMDALTRTENKRLTLYLAEINME